MNFDQSISNQSGVYLLTFTVTDYIDAFTQKKYRDVLIDAFQYCIASKGMELYGYIILFNEVKVIMRSTKNDLSGLLRDYKKHTANTLLEIIPKSKDNRAKWMMKRFEWAGKATSTNEIYKFWKKGNQPQEIFSKILLFEALIAIHYLPVEMGIVLKDTDYIYSSARNYNKQDGLIQMKIPSSLEKLFDNNYIQE